MTKDEIRAKYSRIPTDFSQIELLKNQLLDAGLLDVTQINPENAGKVLKFAEDGSLTVGEAGGGGTQLYQHYITLNDVSRSTFAVYSLSNVAVSTLADMRQLINASISTKAADGQSVLSMGLFGGSTTYSLLIANAAVMTPSPTVNDYLNVKTFTFTEEVEITDTVTPL